jgi:hypothetical protein
MRGQLHHNRHSIPIFMPFPEGKANDRPKVPKPPCKDCACRVICPRGTRLRTGQREEEAGRLHVFLGAAGRESRVAQVAPRDRLVCKCHHLVCGCKAEHAIGRLWAGAMLGQGDRLETHEMGSF